MYKPMYSTMNVYDCCPVMVGTDSNYIYYRLIFITYFAYLALCDISGFSTFTTSIWATSETKPKVSSAGESNFVKLATTSIIYI